MDDQHGHEPGQTDDGSLADPALEAAGARLREEVEPISADAVAVRVLRRRSRRMGALAGAAMVAAVGLGAVAVGQRGGDGGGFSGSTGTADRADAAAVDDLLASLDDAPVDPTGVRLLRGVSTFGDCDALIDELRVVGARHVGSRGFGAGNWGYPMAAAGSAIFNDGFDGRFAATGEAMAADGALARSDAPMASVPAGGETLGTNVQVEGVDELDRVKAVGGLIYDLDPEGDLRITRAEDLEVLGEIDVTPGEPNDYGTGTTAEQILVAGGRVAVFGSEYEVSDPVEGDPSATRSSTQYMTVTFVDVTDPAAPSTTDRVRIEGRLVSARLVDGEIRLVTTADMADLGFVMPTTPNSIPKALDANRRAVATSTAADWIPDWQRDGEDPQPLVPCEGVHVPDTFSGVAMTSMVTFPMGQDLFAPRGTSILAPGDTLYAGLEKVAISSQVWVDPIDRDRLAFDDWQTAIHEFSFASDEAPGYEGTGIVDGSTVGQFAFGEIGDALGVVTTEGTPWSQDLAVGVDLTVLAPDGDGGLAELSKVEDLSSDDGAVEAVRFVPDRVLISAGFFGRAIEVIDVSDPAEPRRAGTVNVPGSVGYFHPLPEGRALMIGSRNDAVGEQPNQVHRSWVQAHLLDVSDADAPTILTTWERPWSRDDVAGDHHAFTYWPERNLAMWGVHADSYGAGRNPNHAAVLRVDGAIEEVAVVEASKAPEVEPPCGVVDIDDASIREMIGRDTTVLRCDDAELETIEWPRYSCWKVDAGTVARIDPGAPAGAYFTCNETGPPAVARVLVVEGIPILHTDQTLERLDPDTFASTAIVYHPSTGSMGWW